MCKSMFFLIGLLYLQSTMTGTQGAKHLECWHCSSDAIGSEDFCGEVFVESNIPHDYLRERNINIVKACNSTINNSYEKAVCRKTVEDVQGKTITKRFCYYTNKGDPLYSCNTAPTDSNIRRSYCEDCTTDKCNSARQLTAMVGSLFLPVILAKLALI